MIRTAKWLLFLTCAVALHSVPLSTYGSESESFGPIYSIYPKTLEEGTRTEILGPLIHLEGDSEKTGWGLCPIFTHRADKGTDSEEYDFLYPIVTMDRFGQEYRFQILQWFAFGGGGTQEGAVNKRFTLFPIYFQQRSPNPTNNYTALLPFYGTLKNRLFRDEIKFVLLPLYMESRKRDVVTDNYLFPFFHLRHGDGLKGWQLWPIVGEQHKIPTTITNNVDELVLNPGHDRFFALWPFFFNTKEGIGSTNEVRQQSLLPFYIKQRSPARDSTTYGFPLGVTHTIEREKKYVEWDVPWPLVVFARGEGKTANRFWPLFSDVRSPILQSKFYLWPVYKFNRATVEPLDRKRTRILMYLYSDVVEKNTGTGTYLRSTDLWPFFTRHKAHDGSTRLQIIAPLEPILPNNKSIERNYSPLWSFWRSERNAKTKVSSDSLLWNLYRADKSPHHRKYSLLFGSFGYETSGADGKWRLFYIPLGHKRGAGDTQEQSK